ncbi:hypothetical protein ACIBSV_42095 [Embleya sp. NPDC050154]|uniref:hypothetical protein n=1 Tax=Embleya sp. NPDC050154 TaxID=3363988 RepID=UPI0037A2FE65
MLGVAVRVQEPAFAVAMVHTDTRDLAIEGADVHEVRPEQVDVCRPPRTKVRRTVHALPERFCD